MKLIKPFLLLTLAALPNISNAQVATTAGSNLTAWNGNSGSTNNNNWNQLTNSRAMAGATAPKADFGNCNSLIMRCAQPKCTGCTSIDIARPIVAGCVNSNATCKQYGNDLIDYIAAQLVATATNKAQQAELAAQSAAAQAAAAQSNEQIRQMQQQMTNMQQQMQAQSQQQMQQMQAALDEQKALVAAAQAEAIAAKQETAAVNSVELTRTEEVRASTGEVTAEQMARERIQDQILSELENAEDALKNLKSTMQNIFTYAGCDTRGNNCRGPKRVSVFKKKAMKYFDPYDAVADAMYDALEKAMAVGVDISDVLMMLSGACNQWAKYVCVGEWDTEKESNKHKIATYKEGENCVGGRSRKTGRIKGGMECADNMVVPPEDDMHCTFTSFINNDAGELQREWLQQYDDQDKFIRIGCPSSSLSSVSILGRSRSKKQSTMDLDTLEKLISQDSTDAGLNLFAQSSGDDKIDRIKYCGLSGQGYENLVKAVQTKVLPKKLCQTSEELTRSAKFYEPANSAWGLAYEENEQIVNGYYNAYDCRKLEFGKTSSAKTEFKKCEIKWEAPDTTQQEQVYECNKASTQSELDQIKEKCQNVKAGYCMISGGNEDGKCIWKNNRVQIQEKKNE